MLVSLIIARLYTIDEVPFQNLTLLHPQRSRRCQIWGYTVDGSTEVILYKFVTILNYTFIFPPAVLGCKKWLGYAENVSTSRAYVIIKSFPLDYFLSPRSCPGCAIFFFFDVSTSIPLNWTSPPLFLDITTVEVRLWLGVGSVSFFDPDDIEEDHSDDTDANSDCSDTSLDHPAFLVTLRFGGDALPGQPQSLSSPYDGWLAVQVKMLQETTLYPVPTAWEVVEALLGHLTSRGGVRACNRVITMGPGAGLIPLRNPPQILDLTFCLERGHLVLDLTAKPRRWWRRSRGDSTLVQKQSNTPVQKVSSYVAICNSFLKADLSMSFLTLFSLRFRCFMWMV